MKTNKNKFIAFMVMLALVLVGSITLLVNQQNTKADEITDFSPHTTETTEEVSSEDDLSEEENSTEESTDSTEESSSEEEGSSEESTDSTEDDTTEDEGASTEDGTTEEFEVEQVDAATWTPGYQNEADIKYVSDVPGTDVVRLIKTKLNGRYQYDGSGPSDCTVSPWVCSTMASYVMNKYFEMGTKMPQNCQTSLIWSKLRALVGKNQVYYVGGGSGGRGAAKKFRELCTSDTIKPGDIMMWTRDEWAIKNGELVKDIHTVHASVVGEERTITFTSAGTKKTADTVMIYHAYNPSDDTCGTPVGDIFEGNMCEDAEWTWTNYVDKTQYTDANVGKIESDYVNDYGIEVDKVFTEGVYTHYYIFRVSGKALINPAVNVYKAGAADVALEGAVFQANFYDTNAIATPTVKWSNMEDATPTRIMYLKSDTAGKVNIRAGCLLYKTCTCGVPSWGKCAHAWAGTCSSMADADSKYGGNYFWHTGDTLKNATVAFPEGSMAIFELSPPAGYILSSKVFCTKFVYDDGELKQVFPSSYTFEHVIDGVGYYKYKNKQAGSFAVQKRSDDPLLDDNRLYSLEGAVFTVYTRAKNGTYPITIGTTTYNVQKYKYTVVKDASGNAVTVTTDADGVGVYSGTLDPGTYYIAETTAPEAFRIAKYDDVGNEAVQIQLQSGSKLVYARLDIESGKTLYPKRMRTYTGVVDPNGTTDTEKLTGTTTGVGNKFWHYKTTDSANAYLFEEPRMAAHRMFLYKYGTDGNASAEMNGAIFECLYYDVAAEASIAGQIPAAKWYFETKSYGGANGVILYDPAFITAKTGYYSDKLFYHKNDGKYKMPRGVYVLREIEAPPGYRVNETWRQVYVVRAAILGDCYQSNPTVTNPTEGAPKTGNTYCFDGSSNVALDVPSSVTAYKQIPEAPNYGTIKLKKASSNPQAVLNNSCYSLAGAKFYLCYDQNPHAVVVDRYGRQVVLVTDANGDAVWGNPSAPTSELAPHSILAGTYYLYEDPDGPKGHQSENYGKEPHQYVWHRVTVVPEACTAVNAGNPLINEALGDPIVIWLFKSQSGQSVPLVGAQYAVKYYKGIQTQDARAVANLTPDRVWYLLTDSNGEATFDQAHLDPSMPNSEFYWDNEPYTDANGIYHPQGKPTFPLGTVTIEETKAPPNFVRDTKVYCAMVIENAEGRGQAVGDSFVTAENERTHPNEPAFVELTMQKKSTDVEVLQGGTGDASLAGAVFGLYLRRDIIYAGNTFAVASQTATVDTPVTFADGTPVVDAYGNPVVTKAGELMPFAVFSPTDATGATTMKELRPATNVDDYYVKELVAPKGYLRNNTVFEIDMRNPDLTQTEKVIEINYTVQESPQKQPIHLMKYVSTEDEYGREALEPYNGIHFELYLISKLKNLDTAKKVVNADGSFTYDFREYDFTAENPEVVTEDGKTELVTGSDGEDGAADTMPLYYGDYVLVETVTPDDLEPVDPMIISIPKYRYNSEGNVQFNGAGDPIIYTFRNADVLNQPVEKYLKINKKNEKDELVLHNSATFTIWDVTSVEDQLVAENDFIRDNGIKVVQNKQTETGFVKVDEFQTNEEGFLLLYDSFKYGTYAIVEEKAPEGYALTEPVIFRVRRDGVEFFVDGGWILGTVYYDSTDREYWEVPVVDRDFELSVAKVDAETGVFVPGAEFTIYKAVNESGDLAIDAEGNPIVLVCEDANGNTVEAIWESETGFKEFNVVSASWYVIRETKTPAGYATMKDVIVYVGDDSSVTTEGYRVITGEDTIYYDFAEIASGVEFGTASSVTVDARESKLALPQKPITVEISKIDSSTEEELPGAILSLYSLANDTETLIETWTSTDEPHVVKYLPVGKYKLHEDTAPLGFYAEPNTIEFTISDTEDVQKHAMINHPIEVEFYKQSMKTGNAVSGATLALYRVSPGPWGPEVEEDEDDDTTEVASTEEEMEASTVEVIDTTETIVGNVDKNTEGLQLVERWVSDGEPYTIVGLYPGVYRLIEEVTPYGFTTSASIDFEITDDKKPEPVIMYDELIECRIQIWKTGETLTDTEKVTCEYGDYTRFIWDDANLEGIQFDIFNDNGDLVETIATDKNGMAYSGKLPFGVYTVKERVPEGWVDNDVVYTIEFKWMQDMVEESLTAKLEVYNESCNTQINIYKTGENADLVDGEYEYTESPLSGVLFGIYAKEDISKYNGELLVKADTCVGYAISDENGVATLDEKLVKGKYYYRELKTAGPQYVIDENDYTFELILANSKIDVFNVNEEDPIVNELVRSHIQVYKISKDGKVPLAGAEFDVYNSDDEVVDHLVTGKDGYAETKELPYGDYYLVETKAPDGYQRVDTEFDANIVVYDEITRVTIENGKTPKLGTFTIVILVGMSLVAAGLGTTVIVITTRRRRRK